MNITPLVYVILTIIGFGLGVTITYEQIKEIRNFKVAFLIGFTSQFGLMPFIGWALSRLFGVNTGISLGMVILCSSPGGGLSNFFCYHSGGNLVLSVVMTAFSTIVAMGMMPLLIWIWADEVGGFEKGTDLGNLEIDYTGLLLTLMFVILPTILGYFTRRTECGNSQKTCCFSKKKRLYEWIFRTSTVTGVCFVVLAFIGGLLIYRDEIFRDWKVVLMVFLILPCGATFGYLAAKLFGLSHKEAVAISYETGVQNRAIALAIIEVHFEEGGYPDKTDVMQAVLHYICLIYLNLCLMWLILRGITKRFKLAEEEVQVRSNENEMVKSWSQN